MIFTKIFLFPLLSGKYYSFLSKWFPSTFSSFQFRIVLLDQFPPKDIEPYVLSYLTHNWGRGNRFLPFPMALVPRWICQTWWEVEVSSPIPRIIQVAIMLPAHQLLVWKVKLTNQVICCTHFHSNILGLQPLYKDYSEVKTMEKATGNLWRPMILEVLKEHSIFFKNFTKIFKMLIFCQYYEIFV